MNSGAIFVAILIAINVITLMFIAPLNSLILAHPYEPVCITCLCTIYGGGVLVVGFSLFLANWWGNEKIALRVQKFLSIVALVSFLHVIQVTTVPSSLNTLYVILCVVLLAPAVIGFLRGQKKTVILAHQFFFILFLYEALNFGQVILQARELEANMESTHNRAGHVALNEDGHHVFWIIFDEFSLVQSLERNDFNVHIVPNLAEFSKTSTWYPHARTLSPVTKEAVSILLLGKKDAIDFYHHFIANFDSKNYFSFMARNMDVYILGYHLSYCQAFKEVVEGCRIFLGSGFSDYGTLVRNLWQRAIPGMLRKTQVVVFLRMLITQLFDSPISKEHQITLALNQGQSFDRPTFTYVHERLPHFPYILKSNGEIRENTYEARPSKRLSPSELEELQNFYREQVTYTDALFGEFVDQLKVKKLYDQSFIVVMSDHGVSFDPEKPGRETLGHEQVDRVPFLIKSPGQTHGVVNPRPVHTAEFFQILLDQMESMKQQRPLPPK